MIDDQAGDVERLMPPGDVLNRTLLSNVHPADWKNPQPDGRYNLVVVGAGTAGLVTAAGAAGLGAKVALVERHLMGGDCLNVGCVPSKALIRAARTCADVRHAGEFGVRIPAGIAVDFPAIMERMRRLRVSLSPNDSARRFSNLGVDVYLGEARFTGPRTVAVGETELHFKNAVIATGTRAAAPSIDGLSAAGYLTNETIFSLTELPRRLAVIGGGPIGCELAQAFARFGSDVTLLEASAQILARESEEAARILRTSFEQDGVHVLTKCTVTSVAVDEADKVLTVQQEAGQTTLRVDQILVAAGRTPNVQGLGLELAHVDFDERTGVKVDDYLRTSNPHIYAAGDICFPYRFTHVADALARIAIQNALFFGRAKTSRLTIPWCTYTDPEVAHVGLSEKEAAKRKIRVDVYRQDFKEVDRAVLDGESNGYAKILTQHGSGKILGATIVARHAGEMISEITTAMAAGLPLGKLANVIHPYPTQADAIRKLGDVYNRKRLTPFLQSLLTRWFAWTR